MKNICLGFENLKIEDFDTLSITTSFKDGDKILYAEFDVLQENLEVIDESFTHAFGIHRDFSFEFKSDLILSSLEDENEIYYSISDDILLELKKEVLDKMQDEDFSALNKIYGYY